MSQSQSAGPGPEVEDRVEKVKYEPFVPTRGGEEKENKENRCCQPTAHGDTSYSVLAKMIEVRMKGCFHGGRIHWKSETNETNRK